MLDPRALSTATAIPSSVTTTSSSAEKNSTMAGSVGSTRHASLDTAPTKTNVLTNPMDLTAWLTGIAILDAAMGIGNVRLKCQAVPLAVQPIIPMGIALAENARTTGAKAGTASKWSGK